MKYMLMKVNYPIYIPSKGRAEKCITADMLLNDDIDFKIVIEEQDYDSYEKKYGKNKLLILPFSDLGLGAYPARNWIKNYAYSKKQKFHWQLDDDLKYLAFYTKR